MDKVKEGMTEVTSEEFWKVINSLRNDIHSEDYIGPGESKCTILIESDIIGYLHRKGGEEEKYFLDNSLIRG